MLADVGIVLAGYLVGSIPSGYWLVRLARADDIRRYGSGNIGASNVWRSFGRRLGIAVALADGLKGFVPVAVALGVAGDWVAVLTGAAAMAGHARPLWLRLQKGGKMVATAGGVSLALAPVPALLCIVVWVVVCVLTRYASLASLAAALALPALCVAFGEPLATIVFALAASAAVFVLHRHNMVRLLHGTESRLSLSRAARV
jgi:acyl phosphate:glycerol-3-phosphate acyltransferase